MATGLMAAGLGATSALAGPADVEAVEVVAEGGSAYSFSVTVRHADEGWEHYADRWEVLGENEDVLATRVLLHPHVDEQPFTRSQNAVQIPAGLTRVTVRAHDKVHGYGGKEMLVDLPGR